MAIKGQKRSSSAHKDQNAAKKQCEGIEKVLKHGTGNLPGDLLASLAHNALLNFKEDRHPLETQAIKFVSEGLAAAKTDKEKELAKLQAEVSRAAQDKVERQQALEASKKTVTELDNAVFMKKADVKTAEDATAAAGEALVAAKKTQKHDDKALVKAEADKAAVDEAVQALLTAADNKVFKKLMQYATECKVDRALADVLAGTLKQAPESRSAFTTNTIKEFEAVLVAKSKEHQATVDAGQAGRAERAAAVQACEDTKKVAKDAEDAAGKQLEELKGKLSDAKKDVKHASNRVQSYYPDMKKLMDSMDKAKTDLDAFINGPLADFGMLKERVKPVAPEPTIETAPAEDAPAAA